VSGTTGDVTHAPARVPHPHARVRLHAHSYVRREGRFFSWFAFLSTFAALIIVLAGGPNMRAVLGPAVAIIAIMFWYLVVLTKRDGHLPIFEAATYFVLATSIYAVVPLLQFVMTGMEAIPGSDARLVMWRPTPQEFGGFAWRHVLLLGVFVAFYLTARGKRMWAVRQFAKPSMPMIASILVLLLLLTGYFFFLHRYLGGGPSVYEGGTLAYLQLPLFLQQITNVLQVMTVTLKQCLIIVLLAGWRKPMIRFALILWLLAQVALSMVALESRAGVVILLLTFLAGYHQIVRPIRIVTAFATGAFILFGFLIFGLLRDLGREQAFADRQATWGAPTEFQILYGNAYDIYRRKLERSLPEVPPQLFLSDLYRLVPSQLLPFYKWDPSVWYAHEVLKWPQEMGFMFGIVAQAVLGYDWIELIVRGALLALFYALAHRTWRRYSGSFWATIAYLFILTWAFYAFRASSFEVLYRLVYYLLPTALTVKLMTSLISVPVRIRERRRRRLTLSVST
jgi:hypothetical protein